MSGGVDSSVAAALMLEAGHEVVGVTLKQWVDDAGGLPVTGCCTVSD
ncbi:MAG: tRNA 2-thiouridine(34) synthase MnmA, partial [Acidobacteriota bacterium]